ncbi:zinc finger FYVE domain-containing protein 9 isoform X3 [Orussus abietinus]|uniref:zinc finger FYVE domain-containing protein 9 isoform X3 n=1 Tax=Orussus abietinus TaxID=222816 RepID=UPI000625BE08|nr:zinc finger FYVE domain-containing protein 9 isoform X3 [Orussus abietinus]
MEKFAVDLDKVLDDFEFNEDRAEQIASNVPSSNQHGVSSFEALGESSSSKVYNDRAKDLDAVNSTQCDSTASLENYIESQLEDTFEKNILLEQNSNDPNISKVESSLENIHSLNHFCTHEQETDGKVQPKQCIEVHDTEPVSLTIHNDISRLLLQKRQNETSSVKVQNSYDKKLNQSNVKPSVSNVFSSLNEYINAPGVHLGYVDGTIKKSDSIDSLGEVSMTESSVNVISNKDSSVTENNSVESEVNLTSNETSEASAKNIPNNEPSRYQNILLPVKLDTFDTDKVSTALNHKVVENEQVPLNGAESNEKICSDNTSEGTERPAGFKSIIDQPEHVYENVYIGTDIPKAQELYVAINKVKLKEREPREQEEAKHTYENIDFDDPKRILPSSENTNIYECIYIGNRENMPETTTELEIAAKNMTDQLYISKKSTESETKSVDTTKLVFQTIKLNAQQSNHKPVSFGHIDDLSEEELNKYLAELEAEEREKKSDSFYDSSSVPESYPESSDNFSQSKFPKSHDDEDVNEAPIFENVTIGELPEVSEERLQEKAKKFPVIDYSKSGPSTEVTNDFLVRKDSEKFHERVKVISEIKEDKGRGRKYKKTDERIRKTSDSSESVTVNSLQDEQTSSGENSLPTGKVENSDVPSTGSIEVIKSPNGDSRISGQKSHSESQIDQETERVIANNIDKLHNSEQSELSKTIESGDGASVDSWTDEKDVSIRSSSTCGIIDGGKPEINAITIENNDSANLGETLGDSGPESVMVVPESSEVVQKCMENDTKQNETSEDDTDRPSRPQTLDIVSTVNMDEQPTIGFSNVTPGSQPSAEMEENVEPERAPSPDASENSSMDIGTVLGKQPPFWVPDNDAPTCMLCDIKFTVLKRRHHCRACGKVLCSKCCSRKYKLQYQGNADSRVCIPCYHHLVKAENDSGSGDWSVGYPSNAGGDINSPQGRQPNPNNPMEYCSTIPPLQQLAGGLPPPPTVMVPVGVLKREGSTKQRSEGQKSVMFSDELDASWDMKLCRKPGSKRVPTPGPTTMAPNASKRLNLPPVDPRTNSYVPLDSGMLPPTVTIHKGQVTYHDVTDEACLYKSLRNECEPPVMFAINRNLFAYVKIVNLNCCVNRTCWNVTSKGLVCVGQDEVVLLVETLPDENQIPKDLFVHINQIYLEAMKGNTITELGVSIHQGGHLLGSREHAGFLFIRQTFQCLQKMVLPPAPFLIGLLVHRWETPWAKVFPLRLVLRLGAEYRYYPCPLVSVRFRDAVYFEIGHTIMKVLADFRNFAYTLPGVRGLTIHMQDTTTDVMFPRNRYDQVIRGLNNSNDHVLAYASNFSVSADSHLVCIQTNSGDESSYQTQAINIHNKPRRVTAASFVVINGALKSSMGLSAKSSIVEDGLMVQIMPEKMEALKAALKNMQDFSIGCGRQGAPEPDEIVNIKWVDNDTQFNLGVKSPIDGRSMDGVPSIRVHNGIDYTGTNRLIRWTEVFIIMSDDHPNGVHDPVDINKLSESIARAACTALVKLLDLLATAGLTKLAVRTTIHADNVGYEAGSGGTRLPPIYMNSLDNELIQVLHKAAQSCQDTYTVLELIFYVLDD